MGKSINKKKLPIGIEAFEEICSVFSEYSNAYKKGKICS